MLRRSTSEIPFSMTFGIEVMILVEVGLSNMRIVGFPPNTNGMAMTKQLDLLE